MRPLAALALFGLLAGCASSTPPAETTTTPAATSVPVVKTEDGRFMAAFPGVVARDESVWLNGTLKAQDAARPPGFPARSPAAPNLVTLDVSKIVPKGVPVVLVGDVVAQMSQGSARIFFTIPPGEGRNNAWGQPAGGAHHIERGILHESDGPVALNLWYDEAEPAPEVPFTLSARVAVDPTVVRAAFPVGLTVGPGVRAVEVQLMGEQRDFAFDLDTPEIMLWGADDAFLGHHDLASATTTLELPNDAGGEYVVMLSQGGRSMRLVTSGSAPPTLRAMPQTFETSDPRPATPEKAEWDATFDRVPLLVGVQFSPPTVAAAVKVKIEGPAGTLVEGRAEGPWMNLVLPTGNGIQTGFGWDSAYGVPGLEAGSYHFLVEMETPAGQDPVIAQDYVAFWSR